jgi:transposase
MSTKKGKRHSVVTFKSYSQHQGALFLPSFEELIPEGHLVRLVSRVIDGLELEVLLNAYAGGGASNYHPKMLLKVLVYGYIDRLYSSRRLEKATRENVNFMWLTGMQTPDHNTINRFRKGQLKDTVKDVFARILLLLVEEGMVRLEDYHIDGTKIESAANRYTFVWAKSVSGHKARLLAKINALIVQIDEENEKEERAAQADEGEEPEPGGCREPIGNTAQLSQTISELNTQMQERLPGNKGLKRKLKDLEGKYSDKLREYEYHESILNGRNSYAKTDHDATFMRMKDDHMQNGQLKPGYNLQIGTEDQFIVNYTIHQSANDMPVLKGHLEDTIAQLALIGKPIPKRASADAGYGSEENYDYLEQLGMENYVKFPGFYQEQDKKVKNNPFRVENLHYNPKDDYFVCPMGQHLTYRYTTKTTSKNGYSSSARVYQAQRCQGCPLRGQCHQAKTDRIIQINPNLQRHKQIARQNLWSIRGIYLRKKRCIEPEPVFGQIKWNRGFKRFLLRGLSKVNCEFGIVAIAHNLKKMWVRLQQARIVPMPPDLPPANAQKLEKSTKIDFLITFGAVIYYSAPQKQNILLGKIAA